jgi:RNA polymerase sigma-70 factor, ECF subfamily
MSIDSTLTFNEIYTTYYKKSLSYVKSYVHDDMAAEDIVSESLIRLWEEMRKITIDPVPPFLFSILKNRSLDYLKHQIIRQNVHDHITEVLNRELAIRTSSLEASDPNDIFSAEVQQIIEKTLQTLPERTREIFVMSRFGNMTYKEIAEQFQISVKGVDYHIMQAVKELKVALKDYLPFLWTCLLLKIN